MNIERILLSNYMPYAKATIVSRAIPSIDGLKPVQRRLLYTMYKMGLLNGDKAKSQRINGQTMALHPHGDGSIYETMIIMSEGNESMNLPYIESKGNFGKVYSKDLQPAAPRYTEAKLAKICTEMFDGIDEDAVDFVDNFDNTLKEPTLLPIKFPSILVNTSAGVAVGTSSNIPSFSLKNVCNATIGIIDGTIKTPAELAKVLVSPEFTTGGFIHTDDNMMTKLCDTGKGSFVISGQVEVYPNSIVITEIPYNTSVEDICDAIEKNIKEHKLNEVKNVRDEIGLNGLRLVVELKNNCNSREVLKKLCQLTPLRTKISFRTRIILNNRCQELGLLDVLNNWLEYRQQSILRVYQHRLDKDTAKEHLLSTWDNIKDHLTEVVQLISKNTDAAAKQLLMTNYKLDEEQAEYLLDMKIRSITKDRAEKALKDLEDTRNRIAYSKKVVSNLDERNSIIKNELTEIINKYAVEDRTHVAPVIDESKEAEVEAKISDETVTVVLTSGGFIRRLTNINDMAGTYSYGDETEIRRWSIKNNEHILVFDTFGVVHKILVDSIDSSRKELKDKLYIKAGLEKQEHIIWVDACGDYSKYFNLIYPNGRGIRVYYNKAEGKRAQYKGLYDEVQPGQFLITTEDKFFLITQKNKAAYCDITLLGTVSSRVAFKIARISNGDWIKRIQPYDQVPNIGLINLNKYNKDYTVSIGDDILWVDQNQIEESRKMREKILEQFNSSENNEENTETDETSENASTEELSAEE